METKAMINDALRYMGIKTGKADEETIQQVTETFRHLEELLLPRFAYDTFEIEKCQDEIRLKNTSCVIKSKDIARLMKNCERVVVLAATLGLKADQEIMRRQRQSMLSAVIFDTCCSVMIDKVCDEIEQEVIKELGEHEHLTMRFSPGYGDVPLDVSRNILSILSAQKRIGLTLTSSDMLLPTKSITAVIGISDQKENRQKSCGTCNLVKSCRYRKRGEKCGL